MQGIKYGLYLPSGEEIPSIKVKLSEEEIEKIVEEIREAIKEEKSKKSILRNLLNGPVKGQVSKLERSQLFEGTKHGKTRALG